MIKISIKELYRNKSNYFNIIFLSISVSLVIFCLSFSDSMNKYWNNSIKKMADYRTFFVYYDPTEKTEEEAMNELRLYRNIESISPYTSYIINMRMFSEFNNIEINMFLFGIPKNTITTTHGENIDIYNFNEKVMVCPEEIFYEVNNNGKMKKKSINLVDSIGKYFPLEFIDGNEVERFRLVGTYDSSTRQGKENFCYTNSQIVTNLNLYYQPEAFQKVDGIIYPLIVRINNINNITSTLQELEKNNFYTTGEAVVKIDTTVGDKVLNLIIFISLILIIISIIIIILVSIKIQYKQKKKYTILKSLGYSNTDIIKLQVIESFLCLIISVLVILLIIYIINFSFQYYFIEKEAMLYGLNLVISINNILPGLAFSLLYYFILILVCIKKLQKIL